MRLINTDKFFISILFSLVLYKIFFNINYINKDGLLYFHQAFLFAQNFFHEAVNLNFQFLMSFFIGKLSVFLNIPISILFKIFMIICLFFIIKYFFDCVKLVNKDQKFIPIIPFVLILLLNSFIDDYSKMILRDIPAWMFYILFIRSILQISNFNKISIKPLIFIFFAALFRIEYLIFFIVTLIYNSYKFISSKYLILTRKLLFFVLIILILLLLFFILKDRIYFFLFNQLPYFFDTTNSIYLSSNDENLDYLLSNNPNVAKFGLVFFLILYKFFSNLGFFGTILAITTFFNVKNRSSDDERLKILKYIISLSFFILFAFVYIQNVLSGRYVFFVLWPFLIYLSYYMTRFVNENKLL